MQPSKKKRSQEKSGAALPWILIASGAALVVVAAVVVIIVLNRGDDAKKGTSPIAKKGDQENKPPDPANPNAKSDPVAKANPIGKGGDPLVEFGGAWLELPMTGVPAENLLTFRVVLAGDSFKLSRSAVGDVEHAIKDRLLEIAGKGVSASFTSDDNPRGDARLITMRMGTIKEDANAFAKRINFGSVRSVSGRVITMVVQKAEVTK
jgi:hypothetical protein